MSANHRLIIIGVGNMGRALASGVLSKGVTAPDKLLLIERNAETCDILRKSFPGTTVCLPTQISACGSTNEDVIFLAVKPRDLEQATQSIKPLLSANPLIISILAGTSLSRISELCEGSRRVLRSMPNLGMQIGSGVTILMARADDRLDDIEYARGLFNACGSVVEVDSEELVDAGTAISGSGPAYLAVFIECVENVAREFGFSNSQSQELVRNTFSGTLSILAEKGISPIDLRKAVTSPGGTTEAALKELDIGGFSDLLSKAITRAYQRAREIAG